MASIAKLTGAQILDFLCGSSTQVGILDKNPNDTHYRAFMLSCLNRVVEDLQNSQEGFHWKFLEKTVRTQTVASQMDYDLPSDIDTDKIVSVSDRTQDRTYRFLPYSEFIRLFPDPTNSSGASLYFTIWASNLKIIPIPDGVWWVYLNYIKLFTLLADDANTIDLPAKYNNVLIDGAMVWAYKFDPELGDWVKQLQVYEAGKEKMIKENRQSIGEYPVFENRRLSRGGELFPLEEL